jgi:hypothetical protein
VERVAPDTLKFAIHGPDPASDEISAAVFGQKLVQLAGAIVAADVAVNDGKRVHAYVVKELHTSTPTAILKERSLARQGTFFPRNSGLRAFRRCAQAIIGGDRATAAQYGACARRIRRFATGAPKRFGYGEIWAEDSQVLRVDTFLAERAARAVDPEEQILTARAIQAPSMRRQWFEGITQGTFDGTIKAVDLRGTLPEIKLILSAGGEQIDCVCKDSDVPKIGAALNRRVRLSGRAIYDRSSPLPIRLEVSEFEILADLGDFMKWSGSFTPFEIEPWPEDSE